MLSSRAMMLRAMPSAGGHASMVSRLAAKVESNRGISRRTAAVLSTVTHNDTTRQNPYENAIAAAMVVGGAMATAWYINTPEAAKCESQMKIPESNFDVSLGIKHSWTPAEVAQENFDDVAEESDMDGMRVFSSDEVSENDGEDGKPVWMSYAGYVYDVTDFVKNHPGGSEKIMMAAGSAIEPFWHLYRQHFASDLPARLMEHMVIGKLSSIDQDTIDEQMDVLYESGEDPYAMEPIRHKALRIHSDQPMNAECPENALTKNYLTSPSLFFIRHHHPVPYLTEDQIKNYKVEIDLSAYGKGKTKISLEDLKKMPKVEVTSTLQCSGNRRSGFNKYDRTSGTTWSQGAISNAKWGGVRMRDVIKYAGLEDALEAEEKDGMKHVQFHSLDGMKASVGIEKVMNPYGDVILCYEMNGEPLPRDHGFPLRAIVPGYAAVRNVKWVNKIQLSSEEAEGPWQRGLNYKILPPNVTDANDVDLAKSPSVMELSVYSGITKVEPAKGYESSFKPGETIMVKASGWAYSGGGRNIVRVDLTGNQARSWTTATLLEGADQRYGRAWAWTFWEATVPAVVQDDGAVHVYSKAVDMSFNVQPETCEHTWNVRGLANNSWYRKTLQST